MQTGPRHSFERNESPRAKPPIDVPFQGLDYHIDKLGFFDCVVKWPGVWIKVVGKNSGPKPIKRLVSCHIIHIPLSIQGKSLQQLPIKSTAPTKHRQNAIDKGARKQLVAATVL
jgi:hypothetical protein